MKASYKKWTKKVLFIRLQAMGDIIATIPCIKSYAKKYPQIELHFLTRNEDLQIPKISGIFYKVWSLKGRRSHYLQKFYLLLKEKFDVIYDLQFNSISNTIRTFLRPKAWTTFDKFSPNHATIRTLNTINKVGLDISELLFIKNNEVSKIGRNFIKDYDVKNKLLVINPAGFFPSRNWPMNNYIEWAELILKYFNNDVTFLWIGVDLILEKSKKFEEVFPKNTLNLVNKTTQVEAYGIIQLVDFILSEDSGLLMHMAWTSGVLLGSTRSDWAKPLGKHSSCFDSSNLSCGNCMLEVCKFEDNRCLTQYSPKNVFNEFLKLI